MRWAIVEVTYAAIAPLDYDAAGWRLQDADGTLHAPAGDPPDPALGAGSLEAGGEATGNITFPTPRGTAIARVILTLEGGGRLVWRVPAEP
jgi:hypothetical protein